MRRRSEDRRGVAGGARPRPLRSPPVRGDRAAVVGRPELRQRGRRLPLRRVRRRALPLGRQVRLRLRLAELLRAARRGRGRDRGPTRATACAGPRCAARPATRISAMCSRTARTRPGSATASTRSRSTSSRRRPTRASVQTLSPLGVWHRFVSRSVRFAHVFRTQGGERERRREVRQARKRHRRERRGRAARHRLHLHRRPDLESGRPVPALLGHAGRHAPAVDEKNGIEE